MQFMKITKTLFVAALAASALLAGPSSRAADSTNTPPAAMQARGGSTLERLTKTLDLTDDQKPKVKAALDAQQTKIKALREDSSLSQDDRRAKLKTIREETSADLKKVLTDEQYAKYEKLSQRRPGGNKPQN